MQVSPLRPQLGHLPSLVVDPARYLFIRLCLRKENKWHRLDQLKYQQEIGDNVNIIKAISELCGQPVDEGPMARQEGVKQEDVVTIDLTLDGDDDESTTIALKTEENSRASTPKFTPTNSDPLLAFAEDETTMALPELLACLSVDELKKLGKQMKLKINLNVCAFSFSPSVTSHLIIRAAIVFNSGFAQYVVNAEHP